MLRIRPHGTLELTTGRKKMKGSWLEMCNKLLAFIQRNEDYAAKKALIGCDDNLMIM